MLKVGGSLCPNTIPATKDWGILRPAHRRHLRWHAQLSMVAATGRHGYGLIGFIALLQILPLFNIDLKPLLVAAGVSR